MLGVVTAMETFCGQAHGARRYALVGVVLQRALLIVGLFCAASIALWTRGTRLLLAMGAFLCVCVPCVVFVCARRRGGGGHHSK